MLTEKIKNIILDLGGVILELDVSLTVKKFKKLGFPDIENIHFVVSSYKFFEEFEIGLISASQLRDEIRKAIGNNISDQHINEAWNAMILGFKKESIDVVKALRKKYRLFLLSNTNEIHEIVYNRQLENEHGIRNLTELFENVYYSHRLHLKKPNREIFEYVLNDSRLIPHETLYIDDSLQHVESAAKLGIQTYHLNPPERITDIFNLTL